MAMDPHRLAREFITEYGTDSRGRQTIRHWRGEFWIYENGCYHSINNGEMSARLTKAIRTHVRAKALVDQHRQLFRVTKGTVTNVANALAGELLVTGDIEQPAWVGADASHTDYIAFRNGVLDVSVNDAARSSALRQPTPHWFSSVCLPYDYDARGCCPKWLAFLDRVLEGDAERIALLQEWCGYLLTPDTSLHKFVVLEGEGANGKSVVLDVVEAMLGRANVAHVPVEVFGDRFQLTGTIGKLANIAPEVNEVIKLNEGVLKQFVAGDRMYFDRKGVPGIDAKPSARLMMATNNRPPVSDRSDGVWRRMLHLPFRVTIPAAEQDHRLAERLKEELPGILNWSLEGRRRLYANGMFTTPVVSVAAIEEYRRESNPAGIFLREHCSLGVDSHVPTDALYEAYRAWTRRNSFSTLNGSQFGKEVKRVYPSVVRQRPTLSGQRAWVYAGLAQAEAVGDLEVEEAA
jgi:putative DNA primase/helicase